MTGRSISEANAEYWNEACGTTAARKLGITDVSADSLQRFDEWYFRFYPYLAHHIPFEKLKGREVLEVGLGYGSVAQELAQHGAHYLGLDVAEGPVHMVNRRLRLLGLKETARVGDILQCPFPAENFDFVIAIGCYHHTGNIGRAIDETWRVLKPGGEAVVMVYNAYSYRRWARWPRYTWRYRSWDRRGGEGKPPIVTEDQRRASDTDTEGRSAPETAFVSIRCLARLCARFSGFQAQTENSAGGRFGSTVRRIILLPTLGRLAGLDIYCHLTK